MKSITPALAILAIVYCPAAFAGLLDSQTYNSSRGSATGNNFTSPYNNQNQQGVSYYQQTPYATSYPSMNGYATPVLMPNGINSASGATRFWRSPASGYYYPWAYGGYRYAPSTVIYQQGQANSSTARPPLFTMYRDMQSFLDDAKTKNHLSASDYAHLNQRLHDLMGKSSDLENSDGGSLSTDDDQEMHNQMNQLGGEIAQRMKN